MVILLIVFIVLYLSLKILEKIVPAHERVVQTNWFLLLAAVNIVAATIAWAFSHLFPVTQIENYWKEVFGFYLIYSFVNYWMHRAKHHPRLWFIHEMHHAPSFMQAEIALWRHPLETFINLIVLSLLCNILGVSYLIAASALLVEGILELLHHSNTRTPKKLRWLHCVIQLPEMHLVHHQRNLHHYNYSPLSLWDWVFSTVKVPDGWAFGKRELGLKVFLNQRKMFFWI